MPRSLVEYWALAFLIIFLPVPVYWLIVHSLIRFWRKFGTRTYYLAAVLWIANAAAVVATSDWLLRHRMEPGAVMILLGAACLAVDGILWKAAAGPLGARTLVGLPELVPGQYPRDVQRTGIYARVRHPRYLGLILLFWGVFFLTGYTSLLILAAINFGLLFLVTVVEERELCARYGAAYRAYQRQVPRLIPRAHLWRAGEVKEH